MGFIRLYLALGVVFLHVGTYRGYTLISGFDAVPVFFILSGFYMSLALNHKYNTYWPFLINRFLKIYPLYLLCVVLCVLAVKGGVPWKMFINGELNLKSFFLLVWYNFFILGSEFISITRFVGDGNLKLMSFGEFQDEKIWDLLMIGPVWSLSVELIFYALAPFLLKRNKSYWWKMLAFFAIGIAYRLFLFSKGGLLKPWSYNLFPASIIFFGLGSVAYTVNNYYRKNLVPRLGERVKFFELSALGAIILLLLFYNRIPEIVKWGGIEVARYMYLAAAITVFLGPLFSVSSKNKWDVFLGDLSYPIYVSHFLFGRYWVVKNIHPVFPTLAFSVVLVFLVVRPIQRYKFRSLTRAKNV